jgi:DNA invertase Pin-like site-specific DNA recombinase
MTLEVQEQICRRYAQSKGMNIDVIFSDPEASAYKVKLQDRPEGGVLLDQCRQGLISDVIVARLDRIFRLVSDGSAISEEWREAGISLHLADEGGCSLSTGTAMGQLMFNMMLSFNQFVPHLTMERTSVAMKHLASKGFRVGRYAQYGYKLGDDGELIPEKREQELIQEILQWHGKGWSVSRIVACLNRAGVDYRGHGWRTRDVKSILDRGQ